MSSDDGRYSLTLSTKRKDRRSPSAEGNTRYDNQSSFQLIKSVEHYLLNQVV